MLEIALILSVLVLSVGTVAGGIVTLFGRHWPWWHHVHKTGHQVPAKGRSPWGCAEPTREVYEYQCCHCQGLWHHHHHRVYHWGRVNRRAAVIQTLDEGR